MITPDPLRVNYTMSASYRRASAHILDQRERCGGDGTEPFGAMQMTNSCLALGDVKLPILHLY